MDNDDKKLEWMYKSKNDMINRDDYLTGKKVDKHFEENTLGNCVEYEVLPASIGRNTNSAVTDKHNQVDILRKEMEDPLLLIKQKELEARRKILENPLKLKKLNEMLKKDKGDTETDKKKKKKKSRSSSSSSNSSDSEDLDKLLMEKYRKLQGKSQPQDEDSNFVDKKFKALTKELDKIVKKKRRSESSSSDEDKRYKRGRSNDRKPNNRNYRSERRNRSREKDDKYNRRDRSNDRRFNDRDNLRDRRDRSRERETKYNRNSDRTDRKRSRSRDRKISKSRTDRKRELSRSYEAKESKHSREDRAKKSNRSRSKEREAKKDQKRSISRSPDRKTTKNTEKKSETPPRRSPTHHSSHFNKSKQFGLVSASGEKLEISKNREIKRYTKDELKVRNEPSKKYEKTVRTQLTDEEKEKRFREMLSNADWREKDREQNVKRYNEEIEKETSQHEKEFDKNFINKNLKHAQDKIGSLENRIRSNVNNIQRSGQSMSENFAKRK